jgi:hypothetical protein
MRGGDLLDQFIATVGSGLVAPGGGYEPPVAPNIAAMGVTLAQAVEMAHERTCQNLSSGRAA